MVGLLGVRSALALATMAMISAEVATIFSGGALWAPATAPTSARAKVILRVRIPRILPHALVDFEHHPAGKARGLIAFEHHAAGFGERHAGLDRALIERHLAQDLAIGIVFGLEVRGLAQQSPAPADRQQAGVLAVADFRQARSELVEFGAELGHAGALGVFTMALDLPLGVAVRGLEHFDAVARRTLAPIAVERGARRGHLGKERSAVIDALGVYRAARGFPSEIEASLAARDESRGAQQINFHAGIGDDSGIGHRHTAHAVGSRSTQHGVFGAGREVARDAVFDALG